MGIYLRLKCCNFSLAFLVLFLVDLLDKIVYPIHHRVESLSESTDFIPTFEGVMDIEVSSADLYHEPSKMKNRFRDTTEIISDAAWQTKMLTSVIVNVIFLVVLMGL